MHEVSNRVWFMFVQAAAARGISRERLAEGLPLSIAELEAPDGRMDWEVHSLLSRRLRLLLGGEREQLIAVGADAVEAPSTLALRAVSELFASATPIYRAAMTWFGPGLFYNVHFGVTELGRGRVRCTLEVPPPYPPCEEFFLFAQGSLAAAPRFIGQPDAQLEAHISERRADFLITVPPPLSLWARAKRVTKVVSAARTAIDELAAQQRSLRESTLAMQRLQYDFRRLIDGLPDGVLVHRAGKIAYTNPAWRGYLGLPRDLPIAGQHIRDYLAPEDPSRAADPWLGAGLRGEAGQLRLRREGGGWVILETAAAQPIDFDGPATLLSARDVTERKQEALKLAVTDRMVSAGTLAAGVAHEVNNPLSYVIANLRGIGRTIARLRPQLPGEVVADLDAMISDAREGAERVSEIVSDLSAFARPDDGATRPVDVHAVLERTLKIASNQIRHRARLFRDYKPTPPVLAGEGRLAQVLLNLLVNAAQAIPEGHADAHEIRVSTRELGPRVLVSIQDSGAGIPDDIRGRIFDPFFTTKPLGTGTGLGLSICHGIVTQLGGTLTVDSTPGAGSTFTVSLPSAEGVPATTSPLVAAAATPDDAAAIAVRSARILIVDDEPRVAAALGRALEGHDVTVVRDGRTAVRLLVGPDASSFDIVFCDLMMPELSGMELHAQLRATRPGLERRLVFMTGGAFTPAAHDFLQHVDNPCLVKPFRIDQVLALVDAIMSAAPGTIVPAPPRIRESRPD
jgi:two-component system cell cycle sensor histidine kinase/response regulator CckA